MKKIALFTVENNVNDMFSSKVKKAAGKLRFSAVLLLGLLATSGCKLPQTCLDGDNYIIAEEWEKAVDSYQECHSVLSDGSDKTRIGQRIDSLKEKITRQTLEQAEGILASDDTVDGYRKAIDLLKTKSPYDNPKKELTASLTEYQKKLDEKLSAAAQELANIKQWTLNVQVGYKDVIKYSKENNNRVWVEMKGEDPSDTGKRNSLLEFEIGREIKAVNADGSVQMAVTFNKVSLTTMNTTSDGQEKTNSYVSQSGQTKSSWEGEPTLSGVTIQATLNKKGEISFIDLDNVRTSLKLAEADNSVVGALITEQALKSVLQRQFHVNCPKGIYSAKNWEQFSETPDTMLNAVALRMEYTPVSKDDKTVTIKTVIEPLYALPEGMPQPQPAGDPFRQILKQNSDLQEPEVDSEAIVDLTTGLVVKDKLNVTYLMIVDGNKLFPEQQAANSEKDAGMMFIEIKINENYEIVK